MYLKTICLVDFLGYMVYGYEYSNKLSQEDRTIAGYRSFQADGIISWYGMKLQEPAPTRSRVWLTGAICKCYDGGWRAVIKQALDD